MAYNANPDTYNMDPDTYSMETYIADLDIRSVTLIKLRMSDTFNADPDSGS